MFSWVHNNIWDTNFPVEQSFETDLPLPGRGRDRVTRPALAARTAPRWCSRCGRCWPRPRATQPPTDRSLLALSDERVRLIGLRHLDDGSIVARLASLDPAGATAELTLPDGTVEAWEATYLGEVVRPLELVDGRVTIAFTGSGARAVGFRLG